MTLPAHFFVSDSDGALYDTRDPDWSQGKPVRTAYRLTVSTFDRNPLKALQQVKAALRAGPLTYMGAYPMYFVTHVGEVMSFEAAREQFPEVCDTHLSESLVSNRINGIEINYENADLICDFSGRRIDAAYVDESEAVA